VCFGGAFHRVPQQNPFTTEGTRVTGEEAKAFNRKGRKENLAEFAEARGGSKFFSAPFAAFLCDLCG
jgi:hypothetical protein